MFIVSLLSIPFILLAIYCIWKCYKKFQDYSGRDNHVENNAPVPVSEEKVEEKVEEHPKPIIRRKNQTKNGSFRSQSLYEDVSQSQRQSNTDFLKDFDERDARRKLLQQQNEEKLKELLEWKSPLEYHSKDNYSKKSEQDFTKFRCQSLYKTNKSKVPDVNDNQVEKVVLKRNDLKIRKATKVDDDTNIDVTAIKKERRHSCTPYIKTDNENKRVSKVINFVAIKTTDNVPEYKPRNKIQQKQQKPLKVDFPRLNVKKAPRRNVLDNLSTHSVEDEVYEIEDVPTFNAECFEADKASLNVCENLNIASSSLVETKFNLEKTPPRSNSLKFSENKRNFLTDKLFAGNIYVGTSYSDQNESTDYEAYEKDRQETYTKWKENFQRKMST